MKTRDQQGANDHNTMKTPQTVDDEADYAEAVHELLSGTLREGLWGKALVEGDGDKEKAKVLYVKYRVALIKEEALRDLLTAFPEATCLPEKELKRFVAHHKAGRKYTKRFGQEFGRARTGRIFS